METHRLRTTALAGDLEGRFVGTTVRKPCFGCGSPGYRADMAKTKNHTTHNQSLKWHRNDIKKSQSQRYKSLKGVDPKFLRNMRCAKKHNKKDLKMQDNNTKAVRDHQGPCEASSHQAQDAKGPQPQTQSGFHRSPQTWETTWPRVGGSVNQSPRLKPRQRPKLQLRLPKVPRSL